MSDLISAAKQALEALEKLSDAAEGFNVSCVYFNEELWNKECLSQAYDSIELLRQAIEQAENQEPVIGTKIWFEDGRVVTQHLHPSDIYKDPQPKAEQEPAMKYEHIRGFLQRCEEHPDHQSGMITHQMLEDRLQEEIDELRAYIEQQPKKNQCARSHPHEDMDEMCELRTEIARLTNQLTQPKAEQVIDKSAAIRIATALGWEPKAEQEPATKEQIKQAMVFNLPLYTHPQPKAEQEPVAWLITDEAINSLQVASIQRLIDRLKHAHHTDICVRINGQDEWHEADWIKHLKRATSPQPQNPLSDEQIGEIWEKSMFVDNGKHANLNNQPFVHFARAIEAAHGIKEKNA